MNDQKRFGPADGLPQTVVIESGIPLPVGSSRSAWAKVWRETEPGETFPVDLRFEGAVRAAARQLGIRYTARKLAGGVEGVRFWRLPDDPNAFISSDEERVRLVHEQSQKTAEIERWLRTVCERKHGSSITSEALFQCYLQAMLDDGRAPVTRREFTRIGTELMAGAFGAHRSNSVPDPMTGRPCKGWRSVTFKKSEEREDNGSEENEKTAQA